MKDLLRLLKLFRPYGFWMGFGIFLALVSTLAGISLMAVSGWFIAAMGLAGLSGGVINYFTPAAIIRASAILRTGGRYAERLVTHEATFHLIAKLRVWFYSKLEPLSPAVLGKVRSGEIFSRLRGDIDKLERFYLGFVVPSAVAVIASIIVVFAFAQYSAKLALGMGLALGIAGFLGPLAGFSLTRKKEESLVDHESALRSQLFENLQGMGELLVYDGANEYENRIERLSEDIKTKQNSVGRILALSQNSIGLITGIALVGVIVLSVPLVKHQDITPPSFAMLALFALAAFEAVAPMPLAFNGLSAVRRAARRIFAMVDQTPNIANPEHAQKCPEKFSLAFEHVTFAYDKHHTPALVDVSFSVQDAEKIAFIGPTGSGKSSLVNLLFRFWDPDKGRICMGGIELAKFDLGDLRAQFSVLPQRPYIFAGSIRRNLLLAKPDATQDEINRVCQQAGLDDFISSLPDGYDTFIGENGRTLSGGQIKRLALARTLLKPCSCLILDEPGEGLDYEMEREILKRVIDNLNGRALILITHRHAGLSEMDKVIYLEDGQVHIHNLSIAKIHTY